MAWITPTEADLLDALSGPEVAAYKSVSLGAGQTDPIPDILAKTISEIRSRVAACKHNQLGPDGTIPDETLDACIALAAWRLITRLPISASVITDTRRENKNDAQTYLNAIAKCDARIVQPETVNDDQAGGPAVQQVSYRERIAKRSDLTGL